MRVIPVSSTCNLTHGLIPEIGSESGLFFLYHVRKAILTQPLSSILVPSIDCTKHSRRVRSGWLVVGGRCARNRGTGLQVGNRVCSQYNTSQMLKVSSSWWGHDTIWATRSGKKIGVYNCSRYEDGGFLVLVEWHYFAPWAWILRVILGFGCSELEVKDRGTDITWRDP